MADESQKDTKKEMPPYVSYITFKNKVREMRDGGKLPSRIDSSCLHNMAGGTQGQFLVALRSLDLIEATGKPTDAMERLSSVDDVGWSVYMKTLLTRLYPNLLPILANGTLKQLREALGADVSQSVAEKSMRFLISACKDAKIPVSTQIQKAKLSAGRTRPSRSRVNNGEGGEQTPGANPPPPPPGGSGAGAGDPWLAKYPDFDPNWPKEIQAQWFEGFAKLMALKEAHS